MDDSDQPTATQLLMALLDGATEVAETLGMAAAALHRLLDSNSGDQPDDQKTRH